MAERHLDHHLRQADAAAIADGEAERRVYCCVCRQYVLWQAMGRLPSMMCAWCENDSRDLDVDAFIERCEKGIEEQEKRKRKTTIRVEDIWGG